MRLLIVTPYHAPAYAFGGPVKVAESTARAFLAAGHAVTIATTDVLDERRRLPAGAPALPPGAEVVRFPNRSHRLAVTTRGWTPRGWLPWIRAQAGAYDLVWLHDIYSVLSVGAARAAAAAGVPFVVQPHGSAAIVAARSKPSVKRAFMALWGRRTLRDAAALLYATDAERDDLRAHGARDAQLVELPPPLELPEAREHHDGGVPPTISFLGRLDPIKGVDRLLEVTALARRRIPGLRLELLGPGDGERRRLEALSSRLGLDGSAVFRGMVPEEEKLATLARVQVSCLLSRSEGLPVAALEAMACGTPVMLSPGCHLPEVHDRAGIVVPDAPAAAAAALVALLEDPDRLARLGAGARAFAERFQAERVNAEALALAGALTAAAHTR